LQTEDVSIMLRWVEALVPLGVNFVSVGGFTARAKVPRSPLKPKTMIEAWGWYEREPATEEAVDAAIQRVLDEDFNARYPQAVVASSEGGAGGAREGC
jgi:hypothetical protein